jgi:hypothetical protein
MICDPCFAESSHQQADRRYAGRISEAFSRSHGYYLHKKNLLGSNSGQHIDHDVKPLPQPGLRQATAPVYA